MLESTTSTMNASQVPILNMYTQPIIYRLENTHILITKRLSLINQIDEHRPKQNRIDVFLVLRQQEKLIAMQIPPYT